jgi:hypothetical protein
VTELKTSASVVAQNLKSQLPNIYPIFATIPDLLIF